MIQRTVVWLLLRLVPSLGSAYAAAIVSILLAFGEAQYVLMRPVVERLIAEADDIVAHPSLDRGYKKFVWVFLRTIEAFPEANSRLIGTMINLLVAARPRLDRVA